MTPPFSEYMEWAKTRSAARFNLASSGVAAFPLAELGARHRGPRDLRRAAYGYAPLQERLARKAGVDPDRVVHATGTSMANLLVLAAAAEPGDEVLIEEPTYSLLVDAARWLRLDVRRFPRRAEEGFRLDPREVERALDAAHAARRPHQPPQPLERLRARRRTCARWGRPRAPWAPASSWTRCTSRRSRSSGGPRARRRTSGPSSS